MLASGPMTMRFPAFAALLLVFAASAASAAPVGRVKTVSGAANLVRAGQPIPTKIGDPVEEKDGLVTGVGGSLGITFTDGTTIGVGPNSRASVETYRFDSKSVKGNLLARIRRGTMSVTSGEITKASPGAVRIETPSAILGVRGTHFLVGVDDED